MKITTPEFDSKLWKRLHDGAVIAPVVTTNVRQLGIGWTNALLPIARRMFVNEPAKQAEFLRNQNGFYCGHPDLLPMAIGAVARAEVDTEQSGTAPGIVTSLRDWTSTSFQMIGWQLFRDGWKPITMLLGLIVGLFAYHQSNAVRAIAVLLFLALYNIPLWSFRLWSVKYGWEQGVLLPHAIEQWNLPRILFWIRSVGAFLIGATFVLTAREWGRIVYTIAAQGAEELAWISIATGFLLGYILLPRTTLYKLLLVFLLAVFGVALFL
ncbi:MAG: PTS system mannose/fructose/sorbose family transporter subunit IID [bacterium]|nr:PTS system mannose/fructose/sorbose family transporter subunit IID [bacterium]